MLLCCTKEKLENVFNCAFHLYHPTDAFLRQLIFIVEILMYFMYFYVS